MRLERDESIGGMDSIGYADIDRLRDVIRKVEADGREGMP
jgi:hypothetical protein